MIINNIKLSDILNNGSYIEFKIKVRPISYGFIVLAVFLALLSLKLAKQIQIRKTIKLNLEYFIAKRLGYYQRDYKVAFSTPIYKSAISAIYG
jgi:hypothetical protein